MFTESKEARQKYVTSITFLCCGKFHRKRKTLTQVKLISVTYSLLPEISLPTFVWSATRPGYFFHWAFKKETAIEFPAERGLPKEGRRKHEHRTHWNCSPQVVKCLFSKNVYQCSLDNCRKPPKKKKVEWRELSDNSIEKWPLRHRSWYERTRFATRHPL